jgi:hypothetical protein
MLRSIPDMDFSNLDPRELKKKPIVVIVVFFVCVELFIIPSGSFERLTSNFMIVDFPDPGFPEIQRILLV